LSRYNRAIHLAGSLTRAGGAALSTGSDDFDRLVEEHARLMSGAIRRVCGHRHRTLIPDVEQEVRLALWKRLQSGKKIEHPVSYIYKVALTTALAILERHVETEALVNPEAEPSPGSEVASPGGMLPAERARFITQTLEQLGPGQARALKAYLAGLSHREVASLFGWSESVARHNIYRGLAALRALGRTEKQDV